MSSSSYYSITPSHSSNNYSFGSYGEYTVVHKVRSGSEIKTCSPAPPVPTKEVHDILNNFDDLSELFEKIKTDNFIHVLYDLFSTHNKLKHYIQQETFKLLNTAQSTSIFLLHRDSVMYKMLLLQLHNDLGRKYLQLNVLPLVRECVDYAVAYTTSLHNTLKKGQLSAIANQNVDNSRDNGWIDNAWIDSAILTFLNNLAATVDCCPVAFREVVLVVYECIMVGCPDEYLKISTQWLFQQFICPTIEDPENTILDDSKEAEINLTQLGTQRCKQLLKKVSDTLILALKARNANNAVTNAMTNYMKALMNTSRIDMVKEVVHSNIIMNEDELRRHAEIQMDSFLQGAKLGTRIQAQLKFEERKMKLMEMVHNDHHDNGFSEVASSKKYGIKVYIKKEGDRQVCFKSVTRLESSMKNLYDIAIDTDNNANHDPRVDYIVYLQKHDDNRRDLYMRYHSNFPISARDYVATHSSVFGENLSYCVIYSIEREDNPPVNKVVRGEIINSGIVLEVDKKDPKFINFTIISHEDPKGNIPFWLIKKWGLAYVEIMKNVQKRLKQRDRTSTF